MRKRITSIVLLVCAVTLFLLSAAVLAWTNGRFTTEEMKNLQYALRTVVENISFPEDEAAFSLSLTNTLRDGIRVTILDLDGDVLADTDEQPMSMENHADRPEIAAALAGGIGENVRFSETTGQRMLYAAQLWGDVRVLRLALPLTAAGDLMRELIPVYVVLCIVALLCVLILSRGISRLALKPYDLLQEDISRAVRENDMLQPYSYTGELRQTALSFNMVLESLHSYIARAKKEAGLVERIITGMNEGVFLLDTQDNILLCNRAALQSLGMKALSDDRQIKHHLRAEEFYHALDTARQSGTMTELSLKFRKKEYLLQVSPAEDGALVILSDMSELMRLERIRRDFTANVSHEMKTPLTAIAGFSELVNEGFVTDEKEIRGYMRTIYNEAKRMTSLVEDILRLSALENAKNKEPLVDTLDLRAAFEEALKLMERERDKKQIQVTFTGSAKARILQEHAQELANNLLSNAIRYNREGGSVCVTFEEKNAQVFFSVKDTGIGIGEEHLRRIFERFYRVDKNRSRETGGTGLGLSIVKHIVKLYGGTIQVTSGPAGTEFFGSLPG